MYGVFAFCPDCGQHNSLQILEGSFGTVTKLLDLASTAPEELGRKLVQNALEDCVSAFDGFGREPDGHQRFSQGLLFSLVGGNAIAGFVKDGFQPVVVADVIFILYVVNVFIIIINIT